MAKSNQHKPAAMPSAPLLYVSDPTPTQKYVKELASLIPEALCLRWANHNSKVSIPSDMNFLDTVAIIGDINSDSNSREKIRNAGILRGFGVKTHFLTINIMNDLSKLSKNDDFGVDHLDIVASVETASNIYKWLFSVLTIHESLYLIPKEQMLKVDNKLFPDYAYCPLSEAKSQPKDAKLQFVALILTKPQIVDGKKLIWTVADRSGTANFYFQWRDSSSQYTWDWVLSMKPGDRRALPRMPMVLVKEKKRARIIKAPFRATGAVIGLGGFAIKVVGKGVCKLGRAMSMGPSSEWVPQADVGAEGKKIDWSKVRHVLPVEGLIEENTVDVFNEKGERKWNDDASVASTDVASEMDEKSGKEFV